VPKVKKSSTASNATAATVGYEAELWQMADALRGLDQARSLVMRLDLV
jgi:hypothetical protein